MTTQLDVALEIGSKRVFASALDWPGWCRSGRTEEAALEALLDYASRYAPVAAAAGVRFPAKPVAHVVERLKGDATTDFGAPSIAARTEESPPNAAQRKRLAALLQASWDCLDDVVAHAPASLRKGPRGGGRDRDKVVEHVRNAERAYAGKLGLTDRSRESIHAAVLEGTDGRWPLRYAVRRIAWHVLDHAWEIEDKST